MMLLQSMQKLMRILKSLILMLNSFAPIYHHGWRTYARRLDQFECPSAGSYPVPTSCAYYYTCTEVEGQLQAAEVEGPTDLLFIVATAQCEKADSFNCNLKIHFSNSKF